MVNISGNSWHYRLIEKYTSYFPKSGLSFCKYCQHILVGICNVIAIILGISFILTPFAIVLPLLITGHFANVQEIKEFYTACIYMYHHNSDFSKIYSILIFGSLAFDLLLVSVVIILIAVVLILGFLDYISHFVFSIIKKFKKYNTSGNHKSNNLENSIVYQWIKSKYEKICSTITIGP